MAMVVDVEAAAVEVLPAGVHRQLRPLTSTRSSKNS
jgi:hypothetical protein